MANFVYQAYPETTTASSFSLYTHSIEGKDIIIYYTIDEHGQISWHYEHKKRVIYDTNGREVKE